MNGGATIFNNEIRIFGGIYGTTKHYKFNGSSWTNISAGLPYGFASAGTVVHNGELHIMGSADNSSYYKYHYKYNGSSWTQLSNLPYKFYSSCAVVHKGKINLLGGAENNTAHYALEKQYYY
jgi:hypothetical protein